MTRSCDNCGYANYMAYGAEIKRRRCTQDCTPSTLKDWIPIDLFFCRWCGDYLCGKHK